MMVPSDNKPSTRVDFARTDEQFAEAWRLGAGIYGSIKRHYPDLGIVRQWWKRFPLGVIRLCGEDGTLWGYFSIWPISREVFLRLGSGGMLEDELEARHIEPTDQAPFQHWYLADICRRKRPPGASSEFSANLVRTLIAGAFRLLMSEKALAQRFEVIAFAATAAGQGLLKKSGFTRVPPATGSPVVASIWTREFGRDAMPDLLGEGPA